MTALVDCKCMVAGLCFFFKAFVRKDLRELQPEVSAGVSCASNPLPFNKRNGLRNLFEANYPKQMIMQCRLWRALAEHALKAKDFDMAEKSFVRCAEYQVAL